MPIRKAVNIWIIILLIICRTSTVVGQISIQQEIEELSKRATHAAQVDYDIDKADSLNHRAIDIANKPPGNQQLLFIALMANMLRGGDFEDTKVDDEYLKLAIDLLNKDISESQKMDLRFALINCLLVSGQVDQANELAVKALTDAVGTDNPLIRIRVNLAMAKVMLARGEPVQAYEHILNARASISDIDEGEGERQSMLIANLTGEVHQRLGDYDQALRLKAEQLEKVVNAGVKDSVQYYNFLLDYCLILLVGNIDMNMEGMIRNADRFSLRNKNMRIYEKSRSIWMSRLIDTEQWIKLKEEFYDKYAMPLNTETDSIELAKLCMGKGMFCAVENKIDSAKLFFSMAIALNESAGDNQAYTANFARRYAQFLQRQGDMQEAYTQYQKALKYARQVKWDKVIIQTTNALDSLSIILHGDYKAAYEYKTIMSQTRDQLADRQRTNDIAIMQIEHDKEQEERLEVEAKEAYKKKRNIQYFGIGVGLIILFIIFIIVSSLAVPNWLINMLGFFSVLFVFEFIILILDQSLHEWAHGNTVLIFLIKVLILSFLFPLHHVIEKGVSTYMVKHQLIRKPKANAFRRFLLQLYPWMDEENNGNGH